MARWSPRAEPHAPAPPAPPRRVQRPAHIAARHLLLHLRPRLVENAWTVSVGFWREQRRSAAARCGRTGRGPPAHGKKAEFDVPRLWFCQRRVRTQLQGTREWLSLTSCPCTWGHMRYNKLPCSLMNKHSLRRTGPPEMREQAWCRLHEAKPVPRRGHLCVQIVSVPCKVWV